MYNIVKPEREKERQSDIGVREAKRGQTLGRIIMLAEREALQDSDITIEQRHHNR